MKLLWKLHGICVLSDHSRFGWFDSNLGIQFLVGFSIHTHVFWDLYLQDLRQRKEWRQKNKIFHCVPRCIELASKNYKSSKIPNFSNKPQFIFCLINLIYYSDYLIKILKNSNHQKNSNLGISVFQFSPFIQTSIFQPALDRLKWGPEPSWMCSKAWNTLEINSFMQWHYKKISGTSHLKF